MRDASRESNPSPERIIRLLALREHPRERGYFAETYRSAVDLPLAGPAAADRRSRSLSTAIYFLVTPDRPSPMHRLSGDEIYHFYSGDPVEILVLSGSQGRIHLLGNDLDAGMRPQIVIPGGAWQGASVAAGGRFALLGTTMAPGFDYADYEAGDPADLASRFPEFASWIAALGVSR
ncbi:MAG: cupin domain-containing protein [Candidatus Eisenbacteria bacterium]|nr:cupin domain-containing protein [Candidatus Eisenbacteria bacterium]